MNSSLKSLPKLKSAPANGLPRVIVIVGPTASGKTSLAVAMAKKYRGEIISADSRQVYRGMDIGTGKDLEEYNLKSKILNLKSGNAKIPYHLIDIVSPKTNFTLAQWQQKAYAAIEDILQRGKVPIVCGGTGLYIDALVQGYTLPQSQKLNLKSQILIKNLKKLTLKQLLARLKKIDAKSYEVIDKQNRRRVERALEIYYQTGITKSQQVSKKKPPYEFTILGIKREPEDLRPRINKRLDQRLKAGMVAEVKRLHTEGVSWKRLESFGLEYKFVSLFLQKKMTKDELREQLQKAIWQFSRRQMTWFRRMDVKWIE